MYILSDILVIALLIKFLWDTVSAGLLPWPIFIVAFIGLPFLLGVGGRTGNRVIRTGVSLAGLAIFFLVHTVHNLNIVYIVIFVIGFGI